VSDVGLAGFLILVVTVFVAAALQASIGFGMGMFAAPIVALIDTDLIPVMILTLALIVTAWTVALDRKHVDVTGTGWALAGRIPGSLVGAFLVAALPNRALAILLALVVLSGVVFASMGWAPHPHRSTLVVAGVASGVLGTVTSIGGPPMALVWQGKSGAGLRGSMNSFGLIGGILSLGALGLAGEIGRQQLEVAGALVPVVLLGVWASRYLNRVLDPVRLRRTVIAMSCFGSALLVVQQIV
jgi:uncharacterized membrane protein YfcA